MQTLRACWGSHVSHVGRWRVVDKTSSVYLSPWMVEYGMHQDMGRCGGCACLDGDLCSGSCLVR